MLNRICLRIFTLFVALFILLPALYGQPTGESGLSIKQSEPEVSDNILATPRKAVHTFLHWQQEGHRRPQLVSQTMDLATDNTEEGKLELAKQLKMTLDSHGLLINYESIPNNPNYTDSLSGQQQYVLFSSLPEIYLVKQGGQWLFSKATIERIPELYQETFSLFVDLVVDNLPESLRKEWLGLHIWQYIALFVWLLIGLILRRIFEFLFENYARRLVARTQTSWDDKLISETEKPISFLFMMVFYWLTFTNLRLSVSTNYYLSTTLEMAVSISFVWLFYNLTNVLSTYLADLTTKTESRLDDQLVPLINKTLKVFIVIIGVIFILQNRGINVVSLLAGLGLGGLAIALAARETLANFFGSITIFMDKPFQVGDLIKTSNAEGVVEEVGFRSTRVRTLYNSLISVPNSILANTEIDNLSLREFRRLKMVLNLTYATTPEQMEAFVEGIKAIIKANKHIRQDLYEVHFNEYGAHSLDVLVYLFFDVPGWSEELQQRHNFLLEIMRLAEEVGIEFAFPTQTLHVDSFFEEGPREVGRKRTEDELSAAVYAFGPDGELSKPEGIHLQKDGKDVNFDSKN